MTHASEEVLVRADSLGRRFGAVVAVADLSFEVRAGECLGLLGPNGAGKSTTLAMLVGQLAPQRGRASILGLDCTERRADIMRFLGYVPDAPEWPPGLSARQILSFVGRAHGVRGVDLRRRVDAALAEHGLAAAADRAAVAYSLGMAKRLALATASLHAPRVLVLDEPGSALDPAGQAELDARVRAWVAGGAGVLLCTHQVEQAERVCDRILLLRAGRAVALGTSAELCERAGTSTLREAFHAIQEGS